MCSTAAPSAFASARTTALAPAADRPGGDRLLDLPRRRQLRQARDRRGHVGRPTWPAPPTRPTSPAEPDRPRSPAAIRRRARQLNPRATLVTRPTSVARPTTRAWTSPSTAHRRRVPDRDDRLGQLQHDGRCRSGQPPAARRHFVAKLNATGKTLAYSTYLGGGGDDRSGCRSPMTSTAPPTSPGITSSTDFPTTVAVSGGHAGDDGFVTKLNPAGTALVYSTYLGGTRPTGRGDRRRRVRQGLRRRRDGLNRLQRRRAAWAATRTATRS